MVKRGLLLIDDDQEMLNLIAAICRRNLPDVQILKATSGAQGLQLAQAEKPGVVVLDVRLPDVDGFEVCRQIRANPATAHTHVLMLSGVLTTATNRTQGIESGADGYLCKPFDAAELLLQIKSLFRWWEIEQRQRETLEVLVAERTQALTEANANLLREIAERKQAEVALRESEQRNRTILRTAMDGFWRADRQGHLLEVNEAYCRMSGYSEQELLAMSIPDVEADETSADTAAHIRKVVAEGVHRFESRHRRKDGSIFAVEVSAQYKPARGHIVSFLRDITERKEAEQERRAVPQRILAAQEGERRRIARELHDGVSQILSCIRLRLASRTDATAGSPTGVYSELDQANKLLDRALREVRRIAWNLRPSELDDLGLLAAIRSVGADFKQRTGIAVEMQLPSLSRRLPSDVELVFYRILQEALSNVEKHAQATSVVIGLTCEKTAVMLSIQDNGRGFVAADPKANRQEHSGMGMINMRERVEFHAGRLEAASVPTGGVEIRAWLPLEACSLEPESES